jgi:Endonuclease/Exonuclease/phosphatase family
MARRDAATEAAPLVIQFQNMALLPTIARLVPLYRGADRATALQTVVDSLRSDPPDVAVLCEVWKPQERTAIVERLRDAFPHTTTGPEYAKTVARRVGRALRLYIGHGGLVVASKHPIIERNQTFFRTAAGADRWSAKGVVHVRLQVDGHPCFYDLYTSHTQNANTRNAWLVGERFAPGGATAKTLEQFDHIRNFIDTTRDPVNPAYLVGDLNIDRFDGAHRTDERFRTVGQWTEAIRRLGSPIDLALGGEHLGDDPRITYNEHTTFPRRRHNPTATGARPSLNAVGAALDHALYYPAPGLTRSGDPTEIVRRVVANGDDISDHYGIRVRQTDMQRSPATS